jgi:hypothetical protein
LIADITLAQVGVLVAMAAQLHRRVIDVQHAHMAKADRAIDLVHGAIHSLAGSQVVTGAPEMGRIYTDADVGVRGIADQTAKLVECTAHRVAGPYIVLQ